MSMSHTPPGGPKVKVKLTPLTVKEGEENAVLDAQEYQQAVSFHITAAFSPVPADNHFSFLVERANIDDKNDQKDFKSENANSAASSVSTAATASALAASGFYDPDAYTPSHFFQPVKEPNKNAFLDPYAYGFKDPFAAFTDEEIAEHIRQEDAKAEAAKKKVK